MKFYVHSPEPLEPMSAPDGAKAVAFQTAGYVLVVPTDWLVPEGEWQPYADGTSGQQGEASAEQEPRRRAAQGPALAMLKQAGPDGMTVIELRSTPGWHHGQASSALSNLDRTGKAFRLAEQRGGAGVYVAAEFVLGRDTVPCRANRQKSPSLRVV